MHDPGLDVTFLTPGLLAAFAVCLLGVFSAMRGFAVTSPNEISTAGFSGGEAGMPGTLRPALYQLMAEQAGPGYHVNKNGYASLPGSSLRAFFNARGARFTFAGAAYSRSVS